MGKVSLGVNERFSQRQIEQMAGNLEIVKVVLKDPVAVAMHLEQLLSSQPDLQAQAHSLLETLQLAAKAEAAS